MYAKKLCIAGNWYDLESHIVGDHDPTPATEGNLSQFYYNSTTGIFWVCTHAGEGVYTWERFIQGSGGGGGASGMVVTPTDLGAMADGETDIIVSALDGMFQVYHVLVGTDGSGENEGEV